MALDRVLRRPTMKFSRISRGAMTMLVAGIVLLAPVRSAYANPMFVNDFDSSWTGTLLAKGIQAAGIAEAELSSLFSNSVTVRINFQATTATGLADANFNSSNFPFPGPGGLSYATIVTDLTNHSAAHPENTALASTVANLPASVGCPTCATNPPQFLLPDAERLALTGAGAGFTNQGFIRINPTFNYDSDRSPIGGSQIDLVAVMLHEITHVMGRVNYAFVNNLAGDPFMTVLDLDRFNCASTTRNTVAANACFSIDGGNTDLRKFSETSDTGDWDSAQVSPNNAFINFGQLSDFQSSDILTMDALGWDPVSAVPEPSTILLLGSSLAGLGAFAWRRQRRK